MSKFLNRIKSMRGGGEATAEDTPKDKDAETQKDKEKDSKGKEKEEAPDVKPAEETRLQAMIFNALERVIKKLKARGRTGSVTVSGSVLAASAGVTVNVEKDEEEGGEGKTAAAAATTAEEKAAIGNAEEQSRFQKRVDEATEKMIKRVESLARCMRQRGLDGSVSAGFDISIVAFGIGVSVDLDLSSFDTCATSPKAAEAAAEPGAAPPAETAAD